MILGVGIISDIDTFGDDLDDPVLGVDCVAVVAGAVIEVDGPGPVSSDPDGPGPRADDSVGHSYTTNKLSNFANMYKPRLNISLSCCHSYEHNVNSLINL